MASAGIGADLAGLHAIGAALQAGRVLTLHVESQRLRHPEYENLVETARSRGVEVELVDDVRPLAGTHQPQGIVATATPIAPAALDAVVAASDPAALVVLDHVEDPRNTGAIVRSMVAAGVASLVVPERRTAPLGATAFKAAAGAFEQVSVARVGSVADAVGRLRDLHVWTIGLDGGADQELFGLELLRAPAALVLGAEGSGLSRLVRERVDLLARIPIAPGVESLNVSAAATLAVFELLRMRSE